MSNGKSINIGKKTKKAYYNLKPPDRKARITFLALHWFLVFEVTYRWMICTVSLEGAHTGASSTTTGDSRVCDLESDKNGISATSGGELGGNMFVPQGGQGGRGIHMPEVQVASVWPSHGVSNVWVDSHFVAAFGQVLSPSISHCALQRRLAFAARRPP